MKEPLEQLTTLRKASTIEEKKEALTTYLDFLCETDECRVLLKKLISHLKDMKAEGNALIVFIPWDYYKEDDNEKEYVRIIFKEPYTGPFDESVPPSFQKVLSRHNGISFSYERDLNKSQTDYYRTSWQFFGVEEGKIKEDGGWESEVIEEGGNDDVIEFLENEGKSVRDVQCVGVFDDLQNWYLLHPIKKNTAGEPALIRFDHGDCDMSSDKPFSFGLGGVIIRELALYIRSIR